MHRPYLTAITSALALAAAMPAQGIELRVRAEPGTRLFFRVDRTMDQDIDMGGQSMQMGNALHQALAITVKEVAEDGTMQVEAEVLHVWGKLTLPMMGEVEFDSAKKSEEPDDGDEFGPSAGMMAKALTLLAGHTFPAKVSALGKVVEVGGVDKFLDEAREKAGRMGAQMLGGTLNSGAVRQLLDGVFLDLPEQAVKVGEPWQDSKEQKSGRGPTMRVDNELTIRAADDDAVTIDGAGTMAIVKPAKDAGGDKAADDEAGPDIEQMIADMSIENAKVAGSARLSRADGMLLEGKFVQTMDISMPSPMGAGDMLIAQKTTVAYRRIDEAEARGKAGK